VHRILVLQVDEAAYGRWLREASLIVHVQQYLRCLDQSRAMYISQYLEACGSVWLGMGERPDSRIEKTWEDLDLWVVASGSLSVVLMND